MGIDPLHLHDLAFEQDRPVRIEFGPKRVMSRQRQGCGEQCRRGA
jgi:hypothetical protein